MSKVKIEGHGTGTGTFTVTTPSSNTDRTITLPDATGTLLNSDGSAASLTAIPAAQITGTLPAISGANLTGIDAATVSTTAPSNPASGDLWFDSTSGVVSMKVYNGTAWDTMSNKFTATGGTVTTHGGYKVHTFTSSGNFVADSTGTVDVLIVAGGGAGGNWHAGGGGAGGMQTLNTTATAQTYSIVIGAGGVSSAL